MIKILKTATISFLTLSFFGCNLSDDVEMLSGNYQYYSEAKNENGIIGPHEIEANVTGYGFDKDFIIAKQVPDKESYKVKLAFDLRNKNRRSEVETQEDVIRSSAQADSIINHDPSYRNMFSGQPFYWIIRHRDSSIYGPLTKQEYLIKRMELGVPSSLEIVDKEY
jgi:hypothetical protein